MKHIQDKVRADSKAHGDAVDVAIEAAEQKSNAIPGLVVLRSVERKRIVKPRTGAERHVRAMAREATKDPRFVPTDVDPAAMVSRLDQAAKLIEFSAYLDGLKRKVDDTVLVLESHSYTDALDVYALIGTHARREPALHALIAAFENFLTHAPSDPAATGTPAATAPAAPPAVPAK